MAALKEKRKWVVPQYAWDASLERAMGNKVLDDPKLIKKSIKKGGKKKRPNHVPSGKNAIKVLLMLMKRFWTESEKI